jgi:hypothetical protein
MVGSVITDPGLRRGGTIWFELLEGVEFDAAGNSLATDFPIVNVTDLGPLQMRHDFEVEPPLGGFPGTYLPPEGGKCNGCIMIEQTPDSCNLDGTPAGGGQAFAFRVGGNIPEGTYIKGVRLYYSIGSNDSPSWNHNHVVVETGTTNSLLEFDRVSGSSGGNWAHKSAWTYVDFHNPIVTDDDLGVAIRWDCVKGEKRHRAFLLDWAEALLSE